MFAINLSHILFSQHKMKQVRLLPTRSVPPEHAAEQLLPPAQEQVTRIEDLDDEALMLSICEGQQQAMDTLYTRYARYAYSLAYRVVHESTAAEDIVQEAFLSVWRKASSYQEQQGSVRSWLQAIIHHRAIDRVRSSAHRDQYVTSLEPEHEQEILSEQPEVWEEAWQHEQAILIRSALEQLPPEQRQVITLAYFDGYTHSEISERWNIPLGTVKGRMRLGLQKMRQLLQARGIDNF